MNNCQAKAFEKHMLPPRIKEDPTETYEQWAQLILSLDMSEEMKQYAVQLQQQESSPVTIKIAEQLYRKVCYYSKNRLESAATTPDSIAFEMMTGWLARISTEAVGRRGAMVARATVIFLFLSSNVFLSETTL